MDITTWYLQVSPRESGPRAHSFVWRGEEYFDLPSFNNPSVEEAEIRPPPHSVGSHEVGTRAVSSRQSPIFSPQLNSQSGTGSELCGGTTWRKIIVPDPKLDRLATGYWANPRT